MYHVRLEQFEGPFPLLLSLIESEKLDITRLALAQVADQYLEHIASIQHVSMENLSSFLSIASRLLLLKSQALLPLLSFTEDEEELIEDLEGRLREYQRYREAADRLKLLLLSSRRSFHRDAIPYAYPMFSPPPEFSCTMLRDAFRRVLASIPVPIQLEERIVADVVTLEECIVLLEERMVRRVESVFSEVMRESKDTAETIVSFLALLELVRRRTVSVEQGVIFGDIRFRRLDVAVR